MNIKDTHRAQTTPIKNGEVPIVCTGAEFIVPQLASNRFVNTAKLDGVVLDVKPNEYLKVQYDNNNIEYIDIEIKNKISKIIFFYENGKFEIFEP